MPKISSGTIHLFTHREGLLSAVGHDLRLSLERFEIDFDEDGIVEGTFYPGSLRVDGAMNRGLLDQRAISTRDLRDIEDNMLGRRVLDVARYPAIRFSGRVEPSGPVRNRATGTLELVGRRAEIAFELRAEAGRLRGELCLTPSRWGIPPFSALLGTLRVKDRVELRLDLPDPRTAEPSHMG